MSNKWKMTTTRSNGIGFWELLQVALIVLKLVNIAIVVAVALALFDH